MNMNPSIKKRIKVFMRNSGTRQDYAEVDAYLVGGEEGVFAAWADGRTVYLAAGDDGFWRYIAAYDAYWFPEIYTAMGMAGSEASKTKR